MRAASDLAIGTHTAVQQKRIRLASPADAYATAVLADSPIAYYELNDASSSLTDYGTNALNGTYGSGIVHQVAGLTQGASSAALFPGGATYSANGFASTAPASALQPSTVSVEAWVKVNAAIPSGVTVPIVAYGTARGFPYALYLQGVANNAARLYYTQRSVSNGNTLLLHGRTNLLPGTIYHIVVAFDGTVVNSYINGLAEVSTAYSGAIAYSANLTNGLQIGGAVLNPTYSGYPSFPGTIAQVAVYGSSLSAKTVLSHYLTGQLLPMVSENSTASDSFVDSFGVDVHFENNHSPYYTQFSQVASLLHASGIRHFRENMATTTDFVTQMKQLANLNLHGTYITSLSNVAADVQSYPALVSPSLEQIEAPNEQDDLNGNTNWIPGCIAFQKNLYSWVKSDPNIAQYPVLGPALAYAANYNNLGDLSSYMDVGNLHDYMGAYNPGFLGGPWNGMLAMIADAKATSGSKPLMVTESGYGTTPGAPSLDNATQLKYITRLFFEQFRAGVSRTYAYELLDEPTNVGGFTTFGLLTNTLTPKPAFTGVQALLTALQDPGPAFTTTSLVYNLSGLSTVHHVLLQKRNGTYVMALWLEVPSWNAVGGGQIAVPPQNVTLTTQNVFSQASISTLDLNGNLTTKGLPLSNKQVSINVTDQISLVTLTP